MSDDSANSEVIRDLEPILLRAQENLNQCLAEYESEHSPLAIDFREFKLQASMFQYEICSEMVGLLRNNAQGFARQVALKGLIHRLYEYDQLVSTHLIARLLVLAKARGVQINSADIKAERRKWGEQLRKLRKWVEIRNMTTGHYDKDIGAQIRLLKQVSQEEVMAVTQAFLAFNITVLNLLRTAGRGGG